MRPQHLNCAPLTPHAFALYDESECWSCVLLCFYSDDEEVKCLCGLHVEHDTTDYMKKTMYPWMAFIFISVNLPCSLFI